MKVSDNFDIKELVSESFFRKWGNNSCWWIPEHSIKMLEGVRTILNKELGKVYVLINNWSRGGGYLESGLRDFTSKTGASYSFHKFGLAYDIKVFYSSGTKVDSNKVFDTLIENEKDCLACGLRAIEHKDHTNGWTHIDCRNTGMDKLKIVKP